MADACSSTPNDVTERCDPNTNEVWNECGPPDNCLPSCNMPEDLACTRECVPRCMCKKGMVYLSGTIPFCIDENECPQCEENEVWTDCGPPENCIPRCNMPENLICNEICVSQCMCKEGMVRDDDGHCINANQCPIICGENEVWTDCGPEEWYEPRCNMEHDMPCNPVCAQRCICKEGMIRNGDGNCIDKDECIEQCGENEWWNDDCASPCSPTCINPVPTCIRRCDPPKCECKSSYVRNEKGNCIPYHQCPELPSLNDHFEL